MEDRRISVFVSDVLFAIGGYGLVFEVKFWYVSAPVALGALIALAALGVRPWIVVILGLLLTPTLSLGLSLILSCSKRRVAGESHDQEEGQVLKDAIDLQEDLNRIQGGGVL